MVWGGPAGVEGVRAGGAVGCSLEEGVSVPPSGLLILTVSVVVKGSAGGVLCGRERPRETQSVREGQPGEERRDKERGDSPTRRGETGPCVVGCQHVRGRQEVGESRLYRLEE